MARYKKSKDGRYHTRITISTPDGKVVKNIAASTIKELDEKRDKIRDEAKSGLVKSRDTLLSEYSLAWNKTANITRRINTRKMYENIIEKHINPAIGHIPISMVVKSDIQGVINDRQSMARTCEQIMMVLKQIFKSAEHDGILSFNPCFGIKVPTYSSEEKRPLTDLEKEAIKKADFTHRERAYIMVIYCFGLRREEALALTKADFDFKNMNLTVNKAITFDVNQQSDEEDTKSSYSVRHIPIPEFSVSFFREYISGLGQFNLFTKLDGTSITKSSYDKMWKSIIKKMNAAVTSDKEIKLGVVKIEGLTSHIFRHNYCTMLYYSDVSIIQAVKLMGHSNSKLIMEVYAHLDEAKENLKEKINGAVNL